MQKFFPILFVLFLILACNLPTAAPPPALTMETLRAEASPDSPATPRADLTPVTAPPASSPADG